MCVCSLSSSGCNAHAPYCHLWPAPLHNIFQHYLINVTILGGKKSLKIKRVFWFPLNFCPKHFSFWEEMSEMWSKMYIGLQTKYRLFLCDFNETWIFATDFRKILKIPNFMKIRPMGAELTNLILRGVQCLKTSSKIGFNCLCQISDHINVNVQEERRSQVTKSCVLRLSNVIRASIKLVPLTKVKSQKRFSRLFVKHKSY